MAADQGKDNAQYNLGLMYYNGLGVKKDVSEALKWIRESAQQGYEKAQGFLTKIGEN